MSPNTSYKRCVMLICEDDIYGESLENMLIGLEDVHLLGPLNMEEDILSHIDRYRPDIVLVAEQEDDLEAISDLTSQILERHPNLPVIRSTLIDRAVRIYSSRELPARTSELVQAIRQLPISRK